MTNKNYTYAEQIKKEMKKREHKKNKNSTQYRRNLKSRARKKNWQNFNDESWDEIDVISIERIMPLDENDRKRKVENSAKQERKLGSGLPHHTADIAGTVLEVSTGLCRVRLEGKEILCAIRGSITAQETGYSNAVVVGDQVLISLQNDGRGMIESIYPRKSVLARFDSFHHRQQAIVANADQMLIITSWRNPHIWPELIDRYLIVAQRNHLPAVLCINKIDLAESQEELHVFADIYHALQVDVLLTSVENKAGLDTLKKIITGKISVLTGLSGVGKSSLLSAMQPGLNLKAKQVSTTSGDGRHTTTQSNLYPLDIGGAVIDTPGIREFGLNGIPHHDLPGFFPEIADYAIHCRFSDCSHIDEPDCAVKQAINDSMIHESRYHSYQLIMEELR
ncbi:MAG: ribosome small subunit-dependent GTPase A [Anaerolineaceae bacterium]|nr:ribosome small subunit-dependent GTPase A [Anaerolineaceae bacterium]